MNEFVHSQIICPPRAGSCWQKYELTGVNGGDALCSTRTVRHLICATSLPSWRQLSRTTPLQLVSGLSPAYIGPGLHWDSDCPFQCPFRRPQTIMLLAENAGPSCLKGPEDCLHEASAQHWAARAA